MFSKTISWYIYKCVFTLLANLNLLLFCKTRILLKKPIARAVFKNLAFVTHLHFIITADFMPRGLKFIKKFTKKFVLRFIEYFLNNIRFSRPKLMQCEVMGTKWFPEQVLIYLVWFLRACTRWLRPLHYTGNI